MRWIPEPKTRQRAVLKTELPHLAGRGTDQSDLQLKNSPSPSCCLLKAALTTLHEVAILLYLTTPTNLVDRRSKYHSHSETTSELLLEHQYQDWTAKE
jgi:hypothetical protein